MHPPKWKSSFLVWVTVRAPSLKPCLCYEMNLIGTGSSQLCAALCPLEGTYSRCLYGALLLCFCLEWLSKITIPRSHPIRFSSFSSSGVEEWANNRGKAPSARTTKGVYRDQPYSRYWTVYTTHIWVLMAVSTQVMDFFMDAPTFLEFKTKPQNKILM